MTTTEPLDVRHALAQIITLATARASSANPDIVRSEQAQALHAIAERAVRAARTLDSAESAGPSVSGQPTPDPPPVAYAEHERAVLEVIAERDRYHETADSLADAIAVLTGVDIGEHSSTNDPWANALEAVQRSAPVRQRADDGYLTSLEDFRRDVVMALVTEDQDEERTNAEAVARVRELVAADRINREINVPAENVRTRCLTLAVVALRDVTAPDALPGPFEDLAPGIRALGTEVKALRENGRRLSHHAARLRSQLAEAREEVGRLSGALTNARAVSAARLADRDKIAHDLIRERDSLREERDRLVAEVRAIGDKLASVGSCYFGCHKAVHANADALRALAAAPVEARSNFQPPNLDRAGDGSSKAPAAPVQPEERRPQYERDAAKLAQPDWCREQLAELTVEASERGLRWKNYAVVSSVIAEIDRARAALATAERQRDDYRAASSDYYRELKAAQDLRRDVVMALCAEDDDEERTDEEIVQRVRELTLAATDESLELDQLRTLRAAVAEIANNLDKAEVGSDARGIAATLRAALGSTPDTGSE